MAELTLATSHTYGGIPEGICNSASRRCDRILYPLSVTGEAEMQNLSMIDLFECLLFGHITKLPQKAFDTGAQVAGKIQRPNDRSRGIRNGINRDAPEIAATRMELRSTAGANQLVIVSIGTGISGFEHRHSAAFVYRQVLGHSSRWFGVGTGNKTVLDPPRTEMLPG